MTKLRFVPIAALALAVLLCSNHASAVNCSITDVNTVAFGPYAPFSGAPGNAQGWVSYQCTLFGAFDKVTIDLSTGSSAQYLPSRTLLTGTHPLNYNLYLDAALTKVWGDGSGSTFHYGPVVLAILETRVYIYGFIPPSQNAWQGSYTDTVTITMLF